MNATVYHQKIKHDADGRTIYIGEDARPYADGEILVVADGLGGRGGYPHSKIDSRILNPDLFYTIVFEPVFEQAVNADFKQMVLAEFDEIFQTRGYYFESSSTIRSSGYFASRLVSVIALYELQYNSDFSLANLFEKLDSVNEIGAKDQLAQTIADDLAKEILVKLQIIAHNVGFEIETKISGAYLLPTTLALTIVREKDEEINVINFWAGDSRNYFWSEDGLAQITEDHEKDETMTNLITLSRPFKLEGSYSVLPKPCVLFNATDGCYKCPVFASPFDLEYILLDSINGSADMDQMVRMLCAHFEEIGKHDDSNTMAISTYGYKDYDALKAAVIGRLKTIDETIISKLPGILEVDYAAELQAAEQDRIDSVFSIKDELVKREAFVEWLKKKMYDATYEPYEKAKKEFLDRKQSLLVQKKKIYLELKAWIKEHWIRSPQLKRNSEVAMCFKPNFWGIRRNPYDEYFDLISKTEVVISKHKEKLNFIEQALRNSFDCILKTMEDVENPECAEKFNFDSVRACEKDIAVAMDYLRRISKGDNAEIQQFIRLKSIIAELNDKYAEYDANAIADYVGKIVNGDILLESLGLGQHESAIRKQIDDYREIGSSIMQLNKEITILADQWVLSFWNEKFEDLIETLLGDKELLVSLGIENELNDCTRMSKQKYDEIYSCCCTRNAIYAEYEKNYSRYCKGTHI